MRKILTILSIVLLTFTMFACSSSNTSSSSTNTSSNSSATSSSSTAKELHFGAPLKEYEEYSSGNQLIKDYSGSVFINRLSSNALQFDYDGDGTVRIWDTNIVDNEMVATIYEGTYELSGENTITFNVPDKGTATCSTETWLMSLGTEYDEYPYLTLYDCDNEEFSDNYYQSFPAYDRSQYNTYMSLVGNND